MKKVILLIIIMFIYQITINAEKKFQLDLIHPQLIKVDNKKIYIVEREKIHIYSLKPFKKILSFGKKGEGPGEFRVHPGTPIMLSLVKDNIIAQTGGSVYYYDKTGKYIKERKIHGQFIASMKSVGNNFIGLSYGNKDKKRLMKILLLDKEFKKIKTLASTLDEKQPGQGLVFLSIPQHLYTCYATDNNYSFTSLGKKMSIKVFDKHGKLIRTISKDYKNLKVNDDYKKRVIKHYKTDPFLKQFFQYLSPITIKNYFPAIRDMRVADNKIYAVTYRIKDDKSEVLIFNINGNFIRTVYMPIQEQDIRLFYPYEIKGNKLYQLVESDDEDFELIINNI